MGLKCRPLISLSMHSFFGNSITSSHEVRYFSSPFHDMNHEELQVLPPEKLRMRDGENWMLVRGRGGGGVRVEIGIAFPASVQQVTSSAPVPLHNHPNHGSQVRAHTHPHLLLAYTTSDICIPSHRLFHHTFAMIRCEGRRQENGIQGHEKRATSPASRASLSPALSLIFWLLLLLLLPLLVDELLVPVARIGSFSI